MRPSRSSLGVTYISQPPDHVLVMAQNSFAIAMAQGRNPPSSTASRDASNERALSQGSLRTDFIFAQVTTRARKRHSLIERYHLGDIIEEYQST